MDAVGQKDAQHSDSGAIFPLERPPGVQEVAGFRIVLMLRAGICHPPVHCKDCRFLRLWLSGPLSLLFPARLE